MRLNWLLVITWGIVVTMSILVWEILIKLFI
jgi:hypothetical protein